MLLRPVKQTPKGHKLLRYTVNSAGLRLGGSSLWQLGHLRLHGWVSNRSTRLRASLIQTIRAYLKRTGNSHKSHGELHYKLFCFKYKLTRNNLLTIYFFNTLQTHVLKNLKYVGKL